MKILRGCGVEKVAIGKAFRCILPGHADKHPSAALYRQPDGVFGYHDFHGKDGHQWYSLPEVFASVKSGKTVKLGPGEQAAWMLRAVVELGYIKAPTLMAPRLPEDTPKMARDVFEGFRLLLAVRSLYDPTQRGAPFSWRFAASWCGITEYQAGQGVTWLQEHRYLQIASRAGGKRKAALLALGPGRAVEH